MPSGFTIFASRSITATTTPPAASPRKANDREARHQRHPPCPHQAIAQRAERAAQRRAQALDLVGGDAVVLGAGRGADREPAQIGVGVEEVRPSRQRRPVRRVVLPPFQAPPQPFPAPPPPPPLHPP